MKNKLKLDLLLPKLPSKNQWKHFFAVLSRREKYIFLVFCLVALFSASFLLFNFYQSRTEVVAKKGGILREGVLGQPKFLNPLYLSNQDIDRDIVEIIFSGLMKYDENGKLTPDLAESYEIKNENKNFEFVLKDALWHDGQPITADDIVFTVDLIQNPEYQSPLRIKLSGILVEPLSTNKVVFKLPKPYPAFLETLTFKILPKHIFKDLPYNNFSLTLASKDYLIGSGPFGLEKISQDSSGFVKKITLSKNKNYFIKEPYLDKIEFIFFKNEKDLINALSSKDIDSASLTSFKNVTGFKNYILGLPRYFALFFNLNQKNEWQNIALRKALAMAINKENIVNKIFANKAQMADSPALPLFFGLNEPEEKTNYNPEEASKALTELGFKLNETTKKRELVKPKELSFVFTKTLTLKNEGEEVKKLQECLAKFPDIYPSGKITGYYGQETKTAVIAFQEKYAEEILSPIGLTKGTGDVKPMTRDKLNQVCFPQSDDSSEFKISITTSEQSPLLEIAKSIQKDLSSLGFEVEVKNVSLVELQTDVLAKRNFDILLFGEALGAIPDPFPFWHSSQKDYPGLNIAGYVSKQADKLLEEAREAQSEEERNKKLEEFQGVFANDLPAILLVRPDYVYTLSSKIKGFNVLKITEPSKRFSTIEEWHFKTKRIWK
ncbi:peptidoglycan-binding protein [Candidatus Gribaldobacteria bacterium]|nr:peptidoglycan-binding protein [Candidatus Gribaldobacteria bacterium]